MKKKRENGEKIEKNKLEIAKYYSNSRSLIFFIIIFSNLIIINIILIINQKCSY